MPERKFALKETPEPQLYPAESMEELAERVLNMEKIVLKKYGRPSDLRKRVEYLEAVLREKGWIKHGDKPIGNDPGIGE